jgi:hypothetical protein
MASQVEIANRALTKLGAARIISFGDDNKQARAVQSMFTIVRDAELRAHLWSFAVKRASLAALVSTPDWGFSAEYELPSDCLRLIQVNDTYQGPDMSNYRNSSTAEYQLEGGKILTDYPAPLKIRYIRREEDTAQWDSTFVEAFACRLAAEMAEDLTQSNAKKDAAWKEYDQAIMLAIRSGAVEQQPQDMPDDSWVLSRI